MIQAGPSLIISSRFPEPGFDSIRTDGLEDWTFSADGRMRKRQMSGNEVTIGEDGRWFGEGVDVNAVEIGEEHW